MKRSEARKQAFLLVYEKSFKEDEPIPEIIANAIEARDFVTNEFTEQLAEGTVEHIAELDRYIEEHSVGWKTSRISKVDKSILRLALYEMLYMESVPVGVSINEAVELAKEFSTGEAASFINGILGSVAKALEGDEK